MEKNRNKIILIILVIGIIIVIIGSIMKLNHNDMAQIILGVGTFTALSAKIILVIYNFSAIKKTLSNL